MHLQLARGNEKEAEDAFTTAVRLNPKSTAAQLALGNFYQHVGKEEAAEEAFQRALVLAPEDIRTNRALAAFYVSTGKPQNAERYLRAIAERTNDPASWSDLADYYTQQRRDADAIRILETISTNPKYYAGARRRIAVIAHAAGRRSEAHTILSELVKRNSADAEALTTQARLLLSDGRYDDALSAAKAAAQADTRSASARVVLGRVLVMRGDRAQARRVLSEAVTLDPYALDARMALAGLHFSENEFDAAIEHARAAIDAHPDNLEARLFLGRALLRRPEDLASARANAESIIRDFPRSAAGYHALGGYYLIAGDKPAAQRQFEEALSVDPGFVDALAELVALDVAAGRSAAARQRLAKHLARRPDDPRVLLLHAKLSMTARQFADAESTLRKAAALPQPARRSVHVVGTAVHRAGQAR